MLRRRATGGSFEVSDEEELGRFGRCDYYLYIYIERERDR